MSLYRIGRTSLDLKIVGAGLYASPLPPAEHPSLNEKERRDLEAFEAAGWSFLAAPDLDWSFLPYLKGGRRPTAGLLARHPSGGLVVLRNRLVLQFEPWVEASTIARRLQAFSLVREVDMDERVFEVELSLPRRGFEQHILDEVDSLLEEGEVVCAEPSLLYHVERVPWGDPLDGPYGKWHWDQIKLANAWALGGEGGKGEGSLVAVIDVGFHPEDRQIKPNVEWTVTLDQDGNVVKGKFMPKDSHGTMCAGLVGAVLDRSEVNGAAPCSKLGLVALGDFRVCSQVALGIALRMSAGLSSWSDCASIDRPADVVSCSLGLTSSNWELSPYLRMAIDCVLSKGRSGRGTPIVWASFDANQRIESWAVEGYYPLLVVSRSDYRDCRVASGWGESLDLLAPGHAVTGIVWKGNDRFIEPDSGSSLAAPCVAGVAALVLSVNPTLSASEVAEVITRSCEPVGSDPIPNKQVGWGRLNAERAVCMALAMRNRVEGVTANPAAEGTPLRRPE